MLFQIETGRFNVLTIVWFKPLILSPLKRAKGIFLGLDHAVNERGYVPPSADARVETG